MTRETVLGAERRRRWTAAEKLRMVEESRSGGGSVAEVARRNDVRASLLYLWRRQARSGVLSASPGDAARLVPVAVIAANRAVSGEDGAEGIRAAVEVVLRNGRMLRLCGSVEPARVALLADALEGLGR